jgi:heme/copper-type cytochrome/quinol oxidase subunit 3
MTATVLSGPFRPQKRVNAMPSEVLGMLVFVLTEVMFFMALVSGFLVIRSQVFVSWSPPGQLKLPVLLTAFNTAVLLVSGVTMALAMRAYAREDGRARARTLFAQTLAFGAFFVLCQGYEWVRLIRYGMTMTSGIFGATFFLLIGAHGLHALVAVLAMARLFLKMRAGTLTLNGFRAMAIFWFFVVGIWPMLYGLVYFG